jgi:hypothetical protein
LKRIGQAATTVNVGLRFARTLPTPDVLLLAHMTDRVHHVWVRPEHMPTEIPGLVLEWRQNPDWEALVATWSPAAA